MKTEYKGIWTLPGDQELFDNAALGIIGQGYVRCTMPNNDVCLVMSSDGKSRCALGWSCYDATPGSPTTAQWDRIKHDSFVAHELLAAHDFTLKKGKEEWQTFMSEIALSHGLDDSCVYMTPVNDIMSNNIS